MSDMSREDSLRKLMLDSMQGNLDAYQVFLMEVSKLIRIYLTKRRGPIGPERIEDLVQEVLMAIHLKKSSYRQDLPVLPWIYTIAKHKLIDEFRSDQRRSRFFNPLRDYQDLFNLEDVYQSKQEVETLLSGFSEKQKEVLIMAKVEKVPLQEIAVQMKMSLSSVKVTVHRTIHGIREKLLKKDLGKGEQ